jgi:hypothetical protein
MSKADSFEEKARLITGLNTPLRSFQALQIIKTFTSLRVCGSQLTAVNLSPQSGKNTILYKHLKKVFRYINRVKLVC